MSSRNKRCPCGSGKKYKNCCAGKNDAAPRVTIPEKLKNANAFYAAGQLNEARALFEEVLRLSPNNKTAISQLSLITISQRDYERSETLLRKAIKLDPSNPVYYSNLGFVLYEDNRPEDAVSTLNKAISINPDYADAFLNRANALTVQGKIDEAIADYKRALKINPGARQARANMAYTMNFSPSVSEEEIFNTHREHALSIEPQARKIFHKNAPTSDRKLRIGYISSDFRQHSVSYFIEPVLEHHDRDGFEIHAYYNHTITDITTEHIIKTCDQWRNIARLSDSAIARLIREDAVDILVDLNGYTANNRLGVLALKPAPVQCEWLGYPNTTGLDSVDYWICDEIVNPPGLTDRFYSESLLRLSGCFLCFKPPETSPQLSVPPFQKNGYVTFGSFNNYAKVSSEILLLWARILGAVPGSRLMLKSACLGSTAQRRAISDFFASAGIEKNRLLFAGYEPSRMTHMEKYAEVDIALDTTPYSGTTTTCEALWMGVPTITLAGHNHRSRVGKTILENAGLGELVANSAEQYIEIAENLARDTPRLSAYRSNLRKIIDRSPLTNAAQFTASLESAYRSIWEAWCSNKHPMQT